MFELHKHPLFTTCLKRGTSLLSEDSFSRETSSVFRSQTTASSRPSVLRLNTGKTSSPLQQQTTGCVTPCDNLPVRVLVTSSSAGVLCTKLLTSKTFVCELTKLQAMPKKWIRRVYRTKFCTNHSARNGKSGWVLLCASLSHFKFCFFS